MKQNKKTLPAELSYYGLYLLDYLRKYHPDKVTDTDLVVEKEEAATVTFEKERLAGGTVEHAHEEGHARPAARAALLALRPADRGRGEGVCRRGAGTIPRGVLPRPVPPSEKPVRRLRYVGRHLRPVARP